ncbi:MAG: DUF4266 domain-containing protein [Gammaproteobacteria bacterium]|nr:DUF4266 domain-containing protein [Pseudomonadales bacterium]MCP5348588.1 DUF4266 domain-containing protein [Pseudomonadales bacterium]
MLLANCTHVEPWQRGTLAKPQMALDHHPLQSRLQTHTYESREAGVRIEGTGGGGCGCY